MHTDRLRCSLSALRCQIFVGAYDFKVDVWVGGVRHTNVKLNDFWLVRHLATSFLLLVMRLLLVAMYRYY